MNLKSRVVVVLVRRKAGSRETPSLEDHSIPVGHLGGKSWQLPPGGDQADALTRVTHSIRWHILYRNMRLNLPLK